jgi:hypothetical protein
MTTDFIQRPDGFAVSPTNYPLQNSVIEPLLWSLGDAPPDLTDEVIFEGRTTTTADGDQEYTVSLPGLPPTEQMTHWMTVDAAHVVSLANRR